jgi:hypothetical protein
MSLSQANSNRIFSKIESVIVAETREVCSRN